MVGRSEVKTKAILDVTKGKVLVIDEASMLNPNSTTNGLTGHTNSFKQGVIGTIVADVQGQAWDDRCVLLLGYRDKMEDMFREGNEGLKRRFQLEDAFDFEDSTADQLLEIWRYKCREKGIEYGEGVEALVTEILERQRHMVNFGNAGEVDNLIEGAKRRCLERINNNNNKTTTTKQQQQYRYTERQRFSFHVHGRSDEIGQGRHRSRLRPAHKGRQ